MYVKVKKPFLEEIVDKIADVEAAGKTVEAIVLTTTKEAEELYKIVFIGRTHNYIREFRDTWIYRFKEGNYDEVNHLLGFPVYYE